MTTYLDIGAVRIQPWLLRTPRLRLLRGASAGLTHLTSRETTEYLLQEWGFGGFASVNDAAGDKDGVSSLTIEQPGEASEVARRVLTELHSHLPGLEWVAWWCDGAMIRTCGWSSAG